MNKLIYALLLAAVPCLTQAQSNSEYSGKNNELYWKNRRPDNAYWQQDVHYKIDAEIDETAHTIDASETLEYVNNSPDTLTYVYFHLFQNAFVKGSYLHDLEEASGIKVQMGRYEAQGFGTVVQNLKVDSKEVKFELDNTILKVYLPRPLYPGGKTSFTMNFKTYWDNGATRRRMKMYDAWGFKHYNGVQWFPKICVYDRKFGWDTYQHLNKEFYGDFGTFDVSLNFPSNYVVEATGALQNRNEVLPDALREKLDIKNFKNKKWNEAPSTITPYVKGERKTWHYKASNVHDFAFTADPSYRIATTYWKGIECVGIAQEPHAAGWQNSAEYVAKIIKTFSEDIGMYQYPKMVAADAADGMEYPMLTLDGGSDPGYRGLLVHELAHNWFYGMVGSNETYRAALDEGFTQFLTAWGLRRIDGDTLVAAKPKSKYRRKFYEPEIVADKRVFVAYTYDALNKEELPLNTHSNDFHNALGHEGGYRGVYYKTASMLYNLQYTLGDSLFQAALQHYFDQWRFAHPYFEDFRSSIIQYTNVDLNWFFDQWIETTKTIDYDIDGIKRIDDNDSFAIKFERKGQMQMPIDFTVTAKDGSLHSFHIPNTWFTKKTDATVLPKWYGWGKLNEEYTANVQVPSGIKHVQLDTSLRLADVDWTNNYKTRGLLPVSSKAIATKLDGGLAAPWDRTHYRLYVRPDLWWNLVDGVKAGVHFEGDYLYSLYKLDATVWLNTHFLQGDDYLVFQSEDWYNRYVPINYTFNFVTPLSKAMPHLKLQVNSRLLDGLWYHRGGFNCQHDNNTLQLYAQTMWRPLAYDRDYLIYPNEWSSARAHPNSSANAVATHSYSYKRGVGNFSFALRAPLLTGNSEDDFNYAYAQLDARNYNNLGKLEVRTRLFGRYGTGTNVPYESALFLAGANPEELMENKYTRSVGFVPNDWRTITGTDMNHFQQGGGLNLRGFAGYFVADDKEGKLLIGYKGRSGASANIEVDFDNYIKLRPKFTRNWLHTDVYLFADAGAIEMSSASDLNQYWNVTPTTTWSAIRADAGLGLAFTIKNWGVFEKAKPLTLRFDMPIVINRPPFANPDYAAFRWVVGVNRCF
ncbi:M1 family metallopeptidase [Polluticoccus soli]|uniref:M1 family metallopeptidase n=1 Tax=Polluticoccus soli TaxID=3034150 RepID=UPI0023E1C0B9|nr:M1 family metallopeptidase [Flavipsychrobacter sp. JY13-12]